MKRLLTLLLAAVLLIPAAIPAEAATLSPALDVLAGNFVMVKAGLSGSDILFTPTDFAQAVGLADFTSLTVTSLPPAEDGALYLGETKLKEGQTIRQSMLKYLTFRAADAAVSSSDFTFSLPEKYALADLTCSLVFLDRINEAPVSAPEGALASVSTFRNVAVSSHLPASDPENDRLTYRVVKAPGKGTLELFDAASGDFRYTPDKNYTGKDSFSYVVCDEYGNYSKLATVNIRIAKNKSGISLADMTGSGKESAAVSACAEGYMQAASVGGTLYFEPDRAVSRAEFVASCLDAAKIDTSLYKKEAASVFDDRGDIPQKYLPAVCTALLAGFLEPSAENERILDPMGAISRAEASAIGARVFGLASLAASAGENGPVSDRAAALDCAAACGMLLPSGGSLAENEPLRRDDCAVLLSAAILASK